MNCLNHSRTLAARLFAAALLLASANSALADVHYVDVNSANATPPYTNWTTAATIIQDAVDAAVAGDEIVVTNGIYATGGRVLVGMNRVVVDKPLSLRSMNGPQFTVIEGGRDFFRNSTRGVCLTDGASLSGFTLTRGHAHIGGGVLCKSPTAVVSNCVITGNRTHAEFAGYSMGGNPIYSSAIGGGVYGGTLNNCILSGNEAETYYFSYMSPYPSPHYVSDYVVGVGGGAADCTLNNCNVSDNSYGGAYSSTLNNCTLTGNSFGAYSSSLNNCIVYFNSGGNQDSSSTLNYCCTTPPPTDGVRNVTNAPLFLDEASGNLRLQSNSPCINAGLNALAPAGYDLDGSERIRGDTVDIGAYEVQLPASRISYAWLQQFGLTATASVDDADPDGDRMNNWQEWRCGTEPTNALSLLRLRQPRGGEFGVIVQWQSVSNQMYRLERSSSLGAAPLFSLLATHVAGQTGTTTYTDTNAVGTGPLFYRVGVQ